MTSANSMMVSPWTARMRPRRDSSWLLASVALIADPSRPRLANPRVVRPRGQGDRSRHCPPTPGPRSLLRTPYFEAAGWNRRPGNRTQPGVHRRAGRQPSGAVLGPADRRWMPAREVGSAQPPRSRLSARCPGEAALHLVTRPADLGGPVRRRLARQLVLGAAGEEEHVGPLDRDPVRARRAGEPDSRRPADRHHLRTGPQ